jgi:hypothetical protein
MTSLPWLRGRIVHLRIGGVALVPVRVLYAKAL